MLRFVAIASVLMFAAGPVLADPPGEPKPTVAKTRRVCHPGASTNPLFPEMKCHMVPVAEAAPPTPPPPAPAPAEMAMQNATAPR